jgi:hypothetical protein
VSVYTKLNMNIRDGSRVVASPRSSDQTNLKWECQLDYFHKTTLGAALLIAFAALNIAPSIAYTTPTTTTTTTTTKTI